MTDINLAMMALIGLISILISFFVIRALVLKFKYGSNPITVGILHSLSGFMAISESAVKDATLMAIDEINAKGGVDGRKIKPIVMDGRSNPEEFIKCAKQLIHKHKVSVVFGCWTSNCRKFLKPVFEAHNHLLFYPLQYEGLEQSSNIIYTGATPNQQIIPAIKWASDNLGKKFFLVGSDYIYPHAVNTIIKDQIKAIGDEVVGETYLKFDSHEVEGIIEQIVNTQPSVIINTINGNDNVTFFKALRENGITPDKIPTISFSIGEEELRSLKDIQVSGDYAAWSYFQDIPSATNQDFVKKYKQKYGKNRVTGDPIEAGYFGVYLWAQAVADAQSDKVSDVLKALKGQRFSAPEGVVTIDHENHHTWKEIRIGRITENGQFNIIWGSGEPIPPQPYPVYRTKNDWETFLNDLYVGWNHKWSNRD